MPELPEVETFARYFAKHALRRRIVHVDVRDARILDEVRTETFVRKLERREFAEVRRHGKHLFARAGRTWLHLHFGMTGDLTFYEGDHPPRFAKVIFDFAKDQHLAFEDVRLFGLAGLVESPDDFIEAKGLGPDPLDPAFTFARFDALLGDRRAAIKSLLMSQEFIAGLGNLYVDEVLYQTSVHPRRAADRLVPAERRAIFTTMRKILRDTIARHGREAALPPRYLIHHREVGERCPRCGGTIRRAVVFGRTTYFCATHQK